MNKKVHKSQKISLGKYGFCSLDERELIQTKKLAIFDKFPVLFLNSCPSLHTHHCLKNNLNRILLNRIVGGKHGEIRLLKNVQILIKFYSSLPMTNTCETSTSSKSGFSSCVIEAFAIQRLNFLSG